MKVYFKDPYKGNYVIRLNTKEGRCNDFDYYKYFEIEKQTEIFFRTGFSTALRIVR